MKSTSKNNIELSQKQTQDHFIAAYSGPIPPASELKKIDDIAPSLVLRIISMAEQDADSNKKLIPSCQPIN